MVKVPVAANLAVALALQGYKVGLLDAGYIRAVPTQDVQPRRGSPLYGRGRGQGLIKPAENYGVKMLSIGFFVN